MLSFRKASKGIAHSFDSESWLLCPKNSAGIIVIASHRRPRCDYDDASELRCDEDDHRHRHRHPTGVEGAGRRRRGDSEAAERNVDVVNDSFVPEYSY